ncbi:MAG: calcium/sodium antiporter [Muribaculaceae bacterium]|nr:calcium/sodium antiporter [Muribaculaceae bacterium]MDE5858354.1 calcium/sodium antiporter [Muribaculaceae bacterium]MDE7369581.1 calcium/sodium antiporter [Muribaculaceae bacterium]
MFLDIVWLIVGLILILVGANALTDGASALAKRMGISDLIVGLTVVAFGTSAPELAISVISASAGNAPLAIGNVVGSNIFNILIIIGITAIVRPIVVSRNIMTLEIPMVILSSVILLVLGNSSILDGGINQVSRVSAIFLLIFFLLFMRYTFASAKQPDLAEAEQSGQTKPMALAKSIIYVVVGLAALVWGGDKFVDGASGIASGLGVSDAVIGLTIVAAGTSLPELATSIVAAVKGKPELAVGNVIGSNIFNVVVVLGISGVITPLPFGSIGNFDLLTLLGASIAFYLFGWFIKTRTITRLEGAILAAGYVAYVGILLSRL